MILTKTGKQTPLPGNISFEMISAQKSHLKYNLAMYIMTGSVQKCLLYKGKKIMSK